MYNKIVQLTQNPSYHVPVQPEIWFAFLQGQVCDLILTTVDGVSSGQAAIEVNKRLGSGHEIAYLQGYVAAKVNLDELLLEILPLTTWAAKNTQELQSLIDLFKVKGNLKISEAPVLRLISMNRRATTA